MIDPKEINRHVRHELIGIGHHKDHAIMPIAFNEPLFEMRPDQIADLFIIFQNDDSLTSTREYQPHRQEPNPQSRQADCTVSFVNKRTVIDTTDRAVIHPVTGLMIQGRACLAQLLDAHNLPRPP